MPRSWNHLNCAAAPLQSVVHPKRMPPSIPLHFPTLQFPAAIFAANLGCILATTTDINSCFQSCTMSRWLGGDTMGHGKYLSSSQYPTKMGKENHRPKLDFDGKNDKSSVPKGSGPFNSSAEGNCRIGTTRRWYKWSFVLGTPCARACVLILGSTEKRFPIKTTPYKI